MCPPMRAGSRAGTAAGRGDASRVTALVAQGANVNATDDAGRSVLCIAMTRPGAGARRARRRRAGGAGTADGCYPASRICPHMRILL